MGSTVVHNIPVITKIASNLIRILGCNPGIMTLQGTNTYLIGNGKKFVQLHRFRATAGLSCVSTFRRILLDTGEPNVSEYVKHLKTVLEQEDATVSNIILSHWHNDHIGGVKDILRLIENANGSFVI